MSDDLNYYCWHEIPYGTGPFCTGCGGKINKNKKVVVVMNIPITKITILHDAHGPDFVTLHTELPSPMPKVTSQLLFLKFETESDTAEEYVRINFPNIPVNVINM